MNNLQIAKVIHESTSALDTSAGIKGEKRSWEQLTEDERNQAASEAGNLVDGHYHGAAPSATSDGISSDDPQLKQYLKQGVVEAFCKREQELAQGPDKQEETVQAALDQADAELEQHNAQGGTV